jgi:hypothetical protein
VSVARQAIDAGVWIHTSHQYGDALHVLRQAIDLDRSRLPRAIFKIGWESVDQILDQVRFQINALGLEKMDVGQLCLGGALAEDFRNGGPGIEALNALKEGGLVDRFVLETWPWSSDVPLAALKAGHAGQLVDAFIFYLNPLQRFVTNELWDLLREEGFPIVAMRTVSGGSVHEMANPVSGKPEYLRMRAAEVAPIYDRSGCTSWPEFCVRFSLGHTNVLATVGATADAGRLKQFILAADAPTPLPMEIVDEVEALQRKWSDEHDRHAAPWSM